MFFLMQNVYNIDGTVTPGVYRYTILEDAMAAFHNGLGAYLKKRDQYNGVLCHVVREDGFVVANQYYDFRMTETGTVAE